MKKILSTLMLTMMAMTTYAAGYDDSDDMLLVVAIILFAIIAIGIAIGLYVLVALMAQKRHRNVVIWVLLSLLASPLLIAIILLAIGDSRKGEEDFV